MSDKIIAEMQTLIEKYGLELMQRYPNDLLVHDKAVLERMAVPGAKIAWMVGHCHTHIVSLGLHQKENEMVTYMTNLASEDRFFVISCSIGGSFTIKETDRDGFTALAHTPVPYRRGGTAEDFWLYRNNSRIGHCSLKSVGERQSPKFNAMITSSYGISALDRAALYLWCSYAITESAHTLFVRSEVFWAEERRLSA